MSPTKEHYKILGTLSLAASDAREETLKSVVVSTLLTTGEIKESEISGWISETFGFKPYQQEITVLISSLVENAEIEKTGQASLKLTPESKLKYGTKETELRDKEKQRFENFSTFVDGLSKGLSVPQKKLLWETFLEYLYNHFYDYGEEALKRLHPLIDFDRKLDKEEDYLQIAYRKLKQKDQCNIFKKVVDQFADFASSDDIEFLNDLAQKTLSFASLGIDPKLAQSSIELDLVDWVLYLDTNVLYSLLDLHSHPENDACKALIQLINDNSDHLQIKIRYSELTKKELNAKRQEFSLLDDKLTSSGIRAMLKSDRLDNFSKEFYSRLLSDRESVIHPSQVIELSSSTLKSDRIDIARNSKRLEQIGADFIDTRIADYQEFITQKNLVKEEFANNKGTSFNPIFKSDGQIRHDISLRELLLHLRGSVNRKGADVSFNTLKYFGVTLDGLLREYDTTRTKDYEDERSFPVFFRPSYLLSKLVKVLPVQTADYKKAFIKAVTSKNFNTDVRKSHDILRIVNYLKSKGIDNEEVVYNLITEDIFLEKYKKSRTEPDFDEKEFFDSELNREFKSKEKELKAAQSELDNQISKTSATEAEKKIVEGKKGTLEKDLGLYEKALKSLKSDVKRLKKQGQKGASIQPSLNFEAASVQSELTDTKSLLKTQIEGEITRHKLKELKRWQRKIWWNLFWMIPVTIGAIWLLMFPSTVPNMSDDKVSMHTIIGLLLLLLDGVFLYLIKSRYLDEGSKKNRLANTQIPQHLSDMLERAK